MYPRVEFEMTEADEKELLDACKATPVILVGGYSAASPQENANRAWAKLGEKMGFEPTTPKPIVGKGMRFFTAVPSETPEARDERLIREMEARRLAAIAQLESESAERQTKLAALTGM